MTQSVIEKYEGTPVAFCGTLSLVEKKDGSGVMLESFKTKKCDTIPLHGELGGVELRQDMVALLVENGSVMVYRLDAKLLELTVAASFQAEGITSGSVISVNEDLTLVAVAWEGNVRIYDAAGNMVSKHEPLCDDSVGNNEIAWLQFVGPRTLCVGYFGKYAHVTV